MRRGIYITTYEYLQATSLDLPINLSRPWCRWLPSPKDDRVVSAGSQTRASRLVCHCAFMIYGPGNDIEPPSRQSFSTGREPRGTCCTMINNRCAAYAQTSGTTISGDRH